MSFLRPRRASLGLLTGAAIVVPTLLLLALPLLALLLLGDRADRVLPRMRDWADRHSWIISEAVVVFFLAVTVVDLLR
ncbi:hypothetical protein AB0K20_21185 [Micromonospora matsumotoense]|uniref:hypothetical protein n=1 Tax=Micromonospora matsumotoense TaxID=121616 RepID=UPI003425EF68